MSDESKAVLSEEQADLEQMSKAFGKDVSRETEDLDQKAEEGETPGTETEAMHDEEADDDLPQPGEKDLHRVQSWVGRKLVKQKEEIESAIEGRLKNLLDGYFPKKEEPEADTADLGEDLEDIVTTKKDVLDLIEKRTRNQEQQQKRYWDGYGKELGRQAASMKLDPNVTQMIAEELDKNMGNPMSHSDPAISARLNFQTAYINVLQKAKPTKKIPGSGEHPASATGLLTPQQNDKGKEPVINLDVESKRLVQALGLKDDTVKKILNKK